MKVCVCKITGCASIYGVETTEPHPSICLQLIGMFWSLAKTRDSLYGSGGENGHFVA